MNTDQGAAGPAPAPARLRRWRLTVLLVVAAIVIAWSAGFVLFAQTLPEAPAAPDRRTDVIVVLTGGTLRLDTGLRLLAAQRGEKLFVSGVHSAVDVAELLRVSRQDPATVECCIVLGYEADNTRGNARETAAWMQEAGYRSLRLVTSAYHMPRSMIEFSAAMPEVEIVPHPVFADHVKSDEWYRFPGTAALIASEYTKTLFAVLRRAAEQLLHDRT